MLDREIFKFILEEMIFVGLDVFFYREEFTIKEIFLSNVFKIVIDDLLSREKREKELLR